MAGNTFGELFKITTFGESHGAGLGVVIDGCPAGVAIDKDAIQKDLDKRKPGVKTKDGTIPPSVTGRQEDDKVEILSGVFEGVSQGTPIALLIRNTNQHSNDYDALKNTFRPSHADYTYFAKYGTRDYRGGGRSSGRETAARVAAGSVAKMVLNKITNNKTKITAYTLEAAGIRCKKIDFCDIDKNPLKAPDTQTALEMQKKIAQLKEKGDSVGGIIECVVKGVNAGLGEPVFNKLDAVLSCAMISIGAVKGIEFGAGFGFASLTGSVANDAMYSTKFSTKTSQIDFLSNNNGGILGGISSGQDIIFRLAIKPVPSIFQQQKTVHLTQDGKLEDTNLLIQGRHDVCLCPRIVPVVEAMTAIVLCDMQLQAFCAKA